MPPEKQRATNGPDTYAVCTGHPDCKGIQLIEDHDAECPDGSGEDCDNDTCYRGCPHCTTEGELN
jgi:hypothetical protein